MSAAFPLLAADDPSAINRPSDEALAEIVGELKKGMDGFKSYKRLEPQTQALADKVNFRLRQLHTQSVPDDVYELLLDWERASKETESAKRQMDGGFSNAVKASLGAWNISPGDGKWIIGGPFNGKRPEWKPEISGESSISVPSLNSTGINKPGPRLISAVPAGRLGATEANGEIYVTPEGLMLLGDYIAKGRENVAAGYLGLILYHESLHYRQLTTSGWHRAYEVDEKKVRGVAEKVLPAFFDPRKDSDVIEFIKAENSKQRMEAIIPELTGGYLAGIKGFGTRTLFTDEELAEMKVESRRHYEALERIVSDQGILKNRLDQERKRRDADSQELMRRAQSAEDSYRRNRIPAASIPRSDAAVPVRIDTVEKLWRMSQRACTSPGTLTQDYMKGWWNLLPAIGFDEAIAGTLTGCERTVFLQLLRWKAQGVNRIEVSDVENVIGPAEPRPESSGAERRRGAPASGGVDYNHCIDPGQSCLHRN